MLILKTLRMLGFCAHKWKEEERWRVTVHDEYDESSYRIYHRLYICQRCGTPKHTKETSS